MTLNKVEQFYLCVNGYIIMRDMYRNYILNMDLLN